MIMMQNIKQEQEQEQEQERVLLQVRLDAEKSQAERNYLGQFATPAALARDILRFGVNLLGNARPIHFLDPAIGTGSFFSALLHTISPARIEIDPAIGTGSFFSALLHTISPARIETAKGYELDAHYAEPARRIWQDTQLDLVMADFTQVSPPATESNRFNLLICNPPYVRHHHIVNSEKMRLQDATKATFGFRISGLAGLYCYFLGLSHAWMQRNGIAGWLIPNEFMDVNYGAAVKQYLLDKVTLLRIHRFDPNNVQFDDAQVSSAVVWFRNAPPPIEHRVEFTFGESLQQPKLIRVVSIADLRKDHDQAGYCYWKQQVFHPHT